MYFRLRIPLALHAAAATFDPVFHLLQKALTVSISEDVSVSDRFFNLELLLIKLCCFLILEITLHAEISEIVFRACLSAEKLLYHRFVDCKILIIPQKEIRHARYHPQITSNKS